MNQTWRYPKSVAKWESIVARAGRTGKRVGARANPLAW
jgi:hypothetical protein